jgi:hypothetical protein
MVDTWLALPTKDWAGSLVSLALGLISAAAAVYATTVVAWAAELQSAIDATTDRDGKVRDPATGEGARARAALQEVRRRDPAHGLGMVVLAVTAMMTALGVVGGLQISDVGWLFTIVPVIVATAIALGGMYLPGRRERGDADGRLRDMAR